MFQLLSWIISNPVFYYGESLIISLPNNQFELNLTTDFDGGVFAGVYNILGQELGFNKKLPKEGNTYKLNLDMSHVTSGVYLIKVGGQTTTSYKTARIIVK